MQLRKRNRRKLRKGYRLLSGLIPGLRIKKIYISKRNKINIWSSNGSGIWGISTKLANLYMVDIII